MTAGTVERPIGVAAATGESDLRGVGPSSGQAAAGGDLRQQELWWILLLLGIAVLVLEGILWLRTQPATPRRTPRLRRTMPVLRLAVVGLLLLALAGLEIARGGRDLAVVFALDLSDSVPAAERRGAVGPTARAGAPQAPP